MRGIDGVSAVWIGIGVALNLLWLGYALDRDLWALVPVSSLSLALYATMAVLYMRIAGTGAFRRLAVGIVGGAAAV